MKRGIEMERLLKVPFGEISLVKVLCKNCGDAAIELPISALVNAQLQCPGCGKHLRRPDVDKAMTQIPNGLMALQNHPEIEVQFVLPAANDD